MHSNLSHPSPWEAVFENFEEVLILFTIRYIRYIGSTCDTFVLKPDWSTKFHF